MKIINYLILFLMMILGGCQDTTDLSTKPTSTNQKKWIQLPTKQNPSLEKEFVIEQIINGEAGGEILFQTSYVGGPYDTVKIYASVVFPPNSFAGDKNITMTVSDDLAVLTFIPSMIFDTPATLNVTFEGLDLSEVNPSTVDFVYQNEDGSGEKVDRKNLNVIKGLGKLILEDAVVPHFSRLGFTR
jgi:hypothetical protein